MSFQLFKAPKTTIEPPFCHNCAYIFDEGEDVYVDLVQGKMVCSSCQSPPEATHCTLTGRNLSDDLVAITPEGPIAVDLWGDTPIKMNTFGEAIIPKHLKILAEVIWKRTVDCGDGT